MPGEEEKKIEQQKSEGDGKQSDDKGTGGNAEAAAIRVKMKELQDQIKDRDSKLADLQKKEQERKDAELSENERLKKQKDEAEATAQRLQAENQRIVKESALKVRLSTMGCVDTDAAIKLADMNTFDPSNEETAKAFVESFKTQKSYLFKSGDPAKMGTGEKEPNSEVQGKDIKDKQKFEEAAKAKDSLGMLKAMSGSKGK